MTEALYKLVYFIAEIHNYILKLNDSFEFYLSDKELHFIIIGILGMLMIFLIYPIFKFLAKRGHYLTLTWIYVFTLIMVITFAIEIGQKITRTGKMELNDILFGVSGFVFMYVCYAIVIETFKLIWKLIKFIINKSKEKNIEETKNQE